MVFTFHVAFFTHACLVVRDIHSTLTHRLTALVLSIDTHTHTHTHTHTRCLQYHGDRVNGTR